jgi:hypothetical protein
LHSPSRRRGLDQKRRSRGTISFQRMCFLRGARLCRSAHTDIQPHTPTPERVCLSMESGTSETRKYCAGESEKPRRLTSPSAFRPGSSPRQTASKACGFFFWSSRARFTVAAETLAVEAISWAWRRGSGRGSVEPAPDFSPRRGFDVWCCSLVALERDRFASSFASCWRARHDSDAVETLAWEVIAAASVTAAA